MGKPTLSPRPSIMRSAISIEKLEVMPVNAVAVAQITRPAVSTRCAPKRSAMAPTGIWMSAYIQKNAENSIPYWPLVRCRSRWISGPAVASAPRSM